MERFQNSEQLSQEPRVFSNEALLEIVWGVAAMSIFSIVYGALFSFIYPYYIRIVAPGISAHSPLGQFLGNGSALAMIWMSTAVVDRNRFVARHGRAYEPKYPSIVNSYNQAGENGIVLGSIFIIRSIMLVVCTRLCVLIVAILLFAGLFPCVLGNYYIEVAYVAVFLWSFETSLKKALSRKGQ